MKAPQSLINSPKNLEDKNVKLVIPFRVTSADTDMEARLRAGSLVNLLIQAAISSADSLGFGYTGIRQQKLFWVLSRLTVEINRPMQWYEEGSVETWPKNIEGLLYLRDYIVRDKKGNTVASATSGWLAVDIESKRPRKIESLEEDLFTTLKDRHAIQESPEKIAAVKEGEQFSLQTTFFDADLNRHVTSSRYIDWMIDRLPLDYARENYPGKISVNFMKETIPGETIQIRVNSPTVKCFEYEGMHAGSGAVSFRGKILF